MAFGRPKGYRGSYRVWEEGGLFPQVVFEVHSPKNRRKEMERKRLFYERHGAQEYYYVRPDLPAFAEGWQAVNGLLIPIPDMAGHVSPRLGWRFEVQDRELVVYGPDGRALQRPDEIAAERDNVRAERDNVRAERDRARTERDRAEHERGEAERRAERLAARMRQLGLDPDNP